VRTRRDPGEDRAPESFGGGWLRRFGREHTHCAGPRGLGMDSTLSAWAPITPADDPGGEAYCWGATTGGRLGKAFATTYRSPPGWTGSTGSSSGLAGANTCGEDQERESDLLGRALRWTRRDSRKSATPTDVTVKFEGSKCAIMADGSVVCREASPYRTQPSRGATPLNAKRFAPAIQ